MSNHRSDELTRVAVRIDTNGTWLAQDGKQLIGLWITLWIALTDANLGSKKVSVEKQTKWLIINKKSISYPAKFTALKYIKKNYNLLTGGVDSLTSPEAMANQEVVD